MISRAFAAKFGSLLCSQYRIRCGLIAAWSRMRHTVEACIARVRRRRSAAAASDSDVHCDEASPSSCGRAHARSTMFALSRGGNGRRTPTSRRVVEPVEAVFQVAPPPLDRRLARRLQLDRDLSIRATGRREQKDPRPEHVSLRRLGPANAALELRSLLGRERDRISVSAWHRMPSLTLFIGISHKKLVAREMLQAPCRSTSAMRY